MKVKITNVSQECCQWQNRARLIGQVGQFTKLPTPPGIAIYYSGYVRGIFRMGSAMFFCHAIRIEEVE